MRNRFATDGIRSKRRTRRGGPSDASSVGHIGHAVQLYKYCTSDTCTSLQFKMHDSGGRTAETRVALGLIALPFVAGIAALVLFPLVYYQRYYAPSPSGGYVNVQGFPLVVRIAIAAAIAAVPLSGLGGAVAIAVWKARGRVALLPVLVIGALVGNVPFVFFGALQQLAYMQRGVGTSFRSVLPDILSAPFAFASTLGVICAAVFWVIAGRALAVPTPSTRARRSPAGTDSSTR
jgi:hypothetical protein